MQAGQSIQLLSDDSWCRRLGNFPSPGWTASAAASVSRTAPRTPLAHRGAAGRENRAALRTQVLQAAFGVAAATALMVSYPAAAQGGMGGGHGGGHGGHGGQSNSQQSPAAHGPDGSSHVPSPLRAMLAEMPKLRADLLLTSTQLGAWSAMEDALRDSVELGRSRAMAPNPTTGADGNTNAELFVQNMADNEHAFSEALERLTDAMKSAMAVLNPRQSKLVHDRFAAAIDAETPGASRQN
jgi:hypothetical protein